MEMIVQKQNRCVSVLFPPRSSSACCCLLLPLFLMSSRLAVVLSQTIMNKGFTKRLYIVRHGQAMHNPRAEKAKAAGCSMEEFFDLMRQDDVLDAPLTDIGKSQAQTSARSISLANNNNDDDNSPDIELVVASSLSRAIQTADLVFNDGSNDKPIRRISLEQLREVNGDFLNAKRRRKSELESDFANWSFDELDGEEDSLWKPEMESFEDAAERGYQGLCWLLDRPEKSILMVSHGGILRYMMNIHPLIKIHDGRKKIDGNNDADADLKDVKSRFDNCEVRGYDLSWDDSSCANNNGDDESMEATESRRTIVLTQVDH